jgi:hypothetical protein
MPRKRRPPRPGALADLAPLRILRKMLLLQAAYYGAAAVLLTFSVLVAGRRPELDLLLGWRTVRGDTTVGWMLALVWLLTSLARYVPAPVLGRWRLMRAVLLRYSSSWCGRSWCLISRSRSISYTLS